MRVLITGASGCVGRYMVEEFLAHTDHDLVCLVRDAGKLPVPEAAAGRVTVLEHDLREVEAYAPRLGHIDCAFLVATSWGGDDAYAVTRDANLALADALITAGCPQLFYFATASVRVPGGGLFPAAGEHGTDYIKSKFQLVEGMEERRATAGGTEITGIYPTLVFGGRREAPAVPLSHFANLMGDLRPYARLLQLISADARFNIVHAHDIARVCRIVAGRTGQPDRLILGNPATDVDTLIVQFLSVLGRRKRTLWKIRPRQVDLVLKVLPMIQLSPWDRFSVDYPDQSHPDAVNPASYGAPVVMPDLASGLRSIGFGAG